MCQHYQSYFSHGQFSRSQIRARVAVCMRLRASTYTPCPCMLPLFLFSEQTFVCLYLYCVCVRVFVFCACCCIKEHRSLRQCRGLWQRKQIFVPLPPTGNSSYTHSTLLWSHKHTHTHIDTHIVSVIMQYRSIRRPFVQTTVSVLFPEVVFMWKTQ